VSFARAMSPFPGPSTSASTFLASFDNSRSETARVRVGLKSLINFAPSPTHQYTHTRVSWSAYSPAIWTPNLNFIGSWMNANTFSGRSGYQLKKICSCQRKEDGHTSFFAEMKQDYCVSITNLNQCSPSLPHTEFPRFIPLLDPRRPF
jgi:hypothetical protein